MFGTRRIAVHAQAGLALFLTGAALGCAPEERPPNVLLVTVDTLRADYLGSYGFPANTSPNVDRLAQQGVLFERAIAASTLTAPSHASIMTSRYVREHSVGHGNGSTRLSDETTLAMLFAAADYDTAAFVGNVNLKRASGLARGFLTYDDELPIPEGERKEAFERTADLTSERALAWLGVRRERPFFLWVHYQDPHGPYTPPSPYDREIHLSPGADEAPLPMLEKHGGPNGVPAYQVIEDISWPTHYRNRYAGEIRYFDHWFGRLLAAVEETDANETIILFTSDHGESMGEEDYFFSHGYATTPNLSHVPFVLKAPGLKPERKFDVVHHVDIVPTLRDLAGLQVPEGMSGIAIGQHLGPGGFLPDRRVYSDTGNEISAYAGDKFMRLRTRGRFGDFKKGDIRTYDWNNGGSWQIAARDIDEAVSSELKRYADKTKSLQRIDEPMSDETIQHLRALGYVE